MLTTRGRAKQPTPVQMLGCDEEFKILNILLKKTILLIRF
jgi:hypothetical protein